MAGTLGPYPYRRVTEFEDADQPVIWKAGTTAPAVADSVDGDLWLDTGTGANGTLMCYNSAGTGWMTVKALT